MEGENLGSSSAIEGTMAASSAKIDQEKSKLMAEEEALGDENNENGNNSNNDVYGRTDGTTAGKEETTESTEQELIVTEGKAVGGMTNVENQFNVSSKSKDYYHVLHPRKGGGIQRFQSHPFGAAVFLSLGASLLVCWCCIMRYRRSTQTHRVKYAALHGSDDFFNGTFSDDVSIREKDSDEEFDDEYSYDSDDDIQRTGGMKLEMGGIHEMDANGGLTLDECNG